jgi:hypothetical protein
MEWRFGQGGGGPDDGSWDRTVAEIRESSAPAALISHEILCRAEPEHVERALASLDFADVHVVYTVRDLGRSIPAMWQEKLKNRELLTYQKFLRQLKKQHRAQSRGQERFPFHLRDFDLIGTLRVWAKALPPEHVHVVVTPESGPPGLLWERFAGLLGIDAGAYDTQVERNTSLGEAEAEFLRLLNIALEDHDLEWREYHRFVKHDLAQRVLAPASASPRIELPEEELAWVQHWTQEQVEFVENSGFDVIGDLAELTPREPSGEAGRFDPDTVAAAGALAAAYLVSRLAQAKRARPLPPAPVRTSRQIVGGALREAALQTADKSPLLARSIDLGRRVRRRLRRG